MEAGGRGRGGYQLFLSVLRWGGVGVGAVQVRVEGGRQVEGWWWWREYGLLLHFRVYYCACEKNPAMVIIAESEFNWDHTSAETVHDR